MEVYLIHWVCGTHCCDADDGIEAVFDSKEKADEYLKTCVETKELRYSLTGPYEVK